MSKNGTCVTGMADSRWLIDFHAHFEEALAGLIVYSGASSLGRDTGTPVDEYLNVKSTPVVFNGYAILRLETWLSACMGTESPRLVGSRTKGMMRADNSSSRSIIANNGVYADPSTDAEETVTTMVKHEEIVNFRVCTFNVSRAFDHGRLFT